MMKVLLLLALATVGQCGLLGSKKCTYGPSYWCSHIHHAKECSAMRHCMSTVWKNQRLDMVGSTETCFDIIKVLDVVRLSHEDKLLEQMAVGCTGLPVEKRPACKELLKIDQKEVLLLLKSDLPTMHIASALGLCGGLTDSVAHPVQVSDDCTDCKKFMADLVDILNKTEAASEDYVKGSVCASLGPLQSMCNDLVDQYLPQIYLAVESQLDPAEICGAIGLCGGVKLADLVKMLKSKMVQRQKSGVECQLCESVAGELQTELRKPDVQKAVMDILENKVCTYLPANLSTECKSYVSQYGPLVFEVLVAELDPPTICQTLGMCNATKTQQPALTHVPVGSSLGTVHILPAQHTEEKGSECSLCKLLMQELETLIPENATEKEIEAALDNVCNILPSAYKGLCDTFVQKYSSTIIQLLLEKAPEEVCSALGVCSSSKLPTVQAVAPVKSGLTCEICEYAMTYVKKEIEDKTVQVDLETLVSQVCTHLPGSYSTECKTLIDQYFPAIINLLDQEIDPLEICGKLSLCDPAKKSESLQFVPMMELQPAKSSLLGAHNKCLYGPSFWCSSLLNAKLCNAVEHCKKRGIDLN